MPPPLPPVSRRVILRPVGMPDMMSDLMTTVTPAQIRTPLGTFVLFREGLRYAMYQEVRTLIYPPVPDAPPEIPA